MSRHFIARYNGPCANECGHRIEPGEEVLFTDDDELVHVSCVPKPPPREHPVCPSCWTTHAGECM